MSLVDPLLLALLYPLVVAVHEAIHYVVARMAGLRGLRLVFDAKRGMLGIRFRGGSPLAIRVSAIAPQVVTLLFLYAWLASSRQEFLVASLLNIVGSLNDFILFLSPSTAGVQNAVHC